MDFEINPLKLVHTPGPSFHALYSGGEKPRSQQDYTHPYEETEADEILYTQSGIHAAM